MFPILWEYPVILGLEVCWYCFTSCVSLGATWQTWSLERWSVTCFYLAVPPGGCLALCRFELQVRKPSWWVFSFGSQYDTFPYSCLSLKMMGKQHLQIARFVDCRMIHMRMVQVVVWEESMVWSYSLKVVLDSLVQKIWWSLCLSQQIAGKVSLTAAWQR